MQSRTPEEIYQAHGKVPANAMTKEERREYDRAYRAEGFRKDVDARYRAKWLDKIRAKDRARKKHRRDGGV